MTAYQTILLCGQVIFTEDSCCSGIFLMVCMFFGRIQKRVRRDRGLAIDAARFDDCGGSGFLSC